MVVVVVVIVAVAVAGAVAVAVAVAAVVAVAGVAAVLEPRRACSGGKGRLDSLQMVRLFHLGVPGMPSELRTYDIRDTYLYEANEQQRNAV